MPSPFNSFKSRLSGPEPIIGLWLGLANAYTAEIAGGAGFDWLLLDGEHAPNDLGTFVGQLQALSSSPSLVVVRAPMGEDWMLKQLLDIGAQTILVPMVDSAEQARRLVRAVRYPPHGIRGVGAALARASRFNRIPDYLTTANEQICLLVQVETRAGLAAIDEIAGVDGVDGIFIGPSDLAADLGHLGRPGAAEVQAAVEDGLKRIALARKPAGILTSDPNLAGRYIELGARFVAVGTDVGLFAAATSALAGRFRRYDATSPADKSSGY